MSRKIRKKPYIPKRRHNPEELATKIDILQAKIDKQKEQRDLVLKALENHFEYLVNFTSHDMKNCLQNLDSVVYNIEIEDFNQETLDTIELCLKNIRTSLDEFSRLVPNSNKIDFFYSELLKAAEIINKNTFSEKSIKFSIDFDKENDINIKQPFHVLLQVLNNLIINSIKAIELSTSGNREILLKAIKNDTEVSIYIADTGLGIPKENAEKIFQIYFTTTGGSGIGLYHAKVSLEEIEGEISLSDNFDNFTTVFLIKFPIINEQQHSDN